MLVPDYEDYQKRLESLTWDRIISCKFYRLQMNSLNVINFKFAKNRESEQSHTL